MRFLAQVRLFERLSGKEQDKVTRTPWGRKIQRLLEGARSGRLASSATRGTVSS
jgi:hypothetical protein